MNLTVQHQDPIASAMYELCSCCLELPCLKSLWSEHMWMGQREVYGDMLKECFNLKWQNYGKSNEQICEVCITHLRSALQFKQRVLQSQARLETRLREMQLPAKESMAASNTDKNIQCSSNMDILMGDDENISLQDLNDDDNGDGMDLIEECDDDPGNKKKVEIRSTYENKKENNLSPENRKKVKIRSTRKSKKETNLRKRIIIIPKDKKRDKIEFRKMNYIKPRQNVCLILEHSTIIPFRSTKGYFACLYCNKQHIGFDELKTHVIQSHENIDFKTILKSILRPHDRVKADVSDITCKLCEKKMDNLEILVSHLTDQHNIIFNVDDNLKPFDSILAYDLSDGKFKCYICKSEFLFFKTLSNHMNAHSTEYVCDVCGRCFLLPERLRAHIQMHIDGKSAKCDDCGKICASSNLLRSHIRYRHQKLSFMCSICNENFPTYRLRMRHLVEIHKRTPLNLTCKVCLKKYVTPSSLNCHMRKEHLKIPYTPKHSCIDCGMLFSSPNALACHAVVHSGVKKFECEFCHKNYARAKSLREHLKIHRNDRRWSCGACAQAFVQKCSLKNHIRVHHVDMESEQLIVYKKPDVE